MEKSIIWMVIILRIHCLNAYSRIPNKENQMITCNAIPVPIAIYFKLTQRKIKTITTQLA